ncbi:DNA-directed RNA polymerase sigma-70 factor [Alteromonas sp. KUL150]|uniref:RNA polymerase sigma factor n=1 Tax=Alteromonas sp. KUL150 TaxID=2480805 RepID=UPI0012E520AB|nr:sigma-70 family RNA polymerase sigma factor [Alteromonas sp. KUL150]GFD86147.1 DNA-directed RNA polymerase sigma-70 factor [Alteromonas sp. KUL150]
MFKKRHSVIDANDATLVMHSLGGDRDAFCEIVTRYQTLLCSLAYSSVGDIKLSEDIAQEAFIVAWKELDTLRDPEKLKAWLCGILRFKVSHHRRKEANNPGRQAEQIEEQLLPENAECNMDSEAIQRQHEALMWEVLDKMDSTYREPLILFYREQQSVERVAAELDLTVDTTKQRLSRGRKLLKSAMSAFVEDALKNSKPGIAFTTAVLSAIGGISPPAKAAAFGAGAANAGSLFKLATLLPLIAASSGFISSFFGLRAGLDQSRTERERKFVIALVVSFLLVAVVFVAGMFGLKYLALSNEQFAKPFAWLSQALVGIFVLSYLFMVRYMIRGLQTLRAQERIFHPEAFINDTEQQNPSQREYRSKMRLFGVPLFHFQFGMPEQGDKPAYGWVAGGNYAYGLLFAWGGIAVAPISVGIFSVGFVTVGAVGLGMLSAGTVAIGLFAFGASAAGYKAYSSLSSLGWESAFSGGFSIAKDAAVGSIALAEQANNELAAQISALTLFSQTYQWALAAMAIMVIVPAAWHSHNVRKRMKRDQRL